jgi:hypothetical protein
MSLYDGHTTIYSVYFLHEPQYIVSTLALMTISCVYLIRTTDKAQAAGGSFNAVLDRSTDGTGQRRGHAGPASAPTVDRWTGRQQDSPHGAHRAAQRATGTEGRTGGISCPLPMVCPGRGPGCPIANAGGGCLDAVQLTPGPSLGLIGRGTGVCPGHCHGPRLDK